MGIRSHQGIMSTVRLCVFILLSFTTISHAAIPDPPSGISIISGNTEASLTWNLVTGATDYIIYRSTEINGPYSFVGRTKINCFANLSLTNSSTYHYVVTAINGDGESPYSIPVSATPIPTALKAPRNIKIYSGNGEVSLSWDSVTSAVDYNVYRISPQGQITLLTPSAPGLSYTDYSVTNGNKYYYAVQTMSTNPGAYSYTLAAEPSSLLPKAPANISAVPGDEWASLTWSSTANTSHYVIFRSTGIGGPYRFQGSVTGTSFEDTDLTNDSSYYYVVTAINEYGSSAFSQEVTVLPSPILRPLPATLIGYSRDGGARLDWNNIPNAVSYSVYRSESSSSLGSFVGSATTSAFTDDGAEDVPLTNGIAYYYRVLTNNASSVHPQSNVFQITPQAELSAPSNIEVHPGNTQITLTWDPVPGAYSYYIQFTTTPGGPYSTAGSVSNGKTCFTDTALTNDQTYYYRIKADLYGQGGQNYSAEYAVTPRDTLPLAPTSITGQTGNTQVSLRWNAVAGATGYQVFRRTRFSQWSQLPHPPLNETFYNDTGLTNGISYYYIVAAINSSGSGAWATAEQSATPIDSNSLVPKNITGISGNTQATITWDPIDGVTGYYIQVAETPGGSSIDTGSVSNGKTSYTATGLTNGQEYYFRVRSYQPSGSMYSEDIQITPVTPLPLAPGSISGEAGNTQVRLRWDTVVGASSYNVFRRTFSSNWRLISPSPVNATFLNDTGLTNGITYYYIVQAINGSGTGAWATSEGSFTPQDENNVAPTNIVGIPGYTQATITWFPVLGATNYSIQVSTSPGGQAFQSGYTSNGKTSYTATGLTNEQTYYFRVRASVPEASMYSADVSITPTTILPEAPTSLSSYPGNSQVSLTWASVVGATGYNIYRRTNSTSTSAILVGTVTGTLFIDSGLINGTEYFYSVAAVNANGQGAWSTSEENVTPESNHLFAPTNLSGIPGNTQFTVTWDPVVGATGYYVTVATTPGGPRYTSVSTSNGKTSATISNVANGATYFVRVRATNPSSSAENGEINLTPSALLPLAPSSIFCRAPGNTQATISWSDVENALGYKIYRRTQLSAWSSPAVGSTAIPLFNDENLVNATPYFYVVSAVNSYGEGAWTYSEAPCTPTDIKPYAPANVNAVSGNTQVSLSWNSVPSAAQYRVMRSTLSGGPYSTIAYPNTTSYIATNLLNNQPYYFVIQAMNSSNEWSAYSSQVFAIPSYTNPDTDNDGIADSWELSFFKSLTMCDSDSDFDKDNYTDLQEYLNWKNNISDPLGNQFNPMEINAPGGYGYGGILPAPGILQLMMPAILYGHQKQ